MAEHWKVGELARATGLSIRTVRYYDQIGLLTPSYRTSAGHRVYDDAGNCVHGEVQAGDGMIWLHPSLPRFGLASPQTLGGTTGTTAVMIDNVDAHHAHAVEAGAEIVYPPTDQPYGFREYSARDPEGGLWSFMKPLG